MEKPVVKTKILYELRLAYEEGVVNVNGARGLVVGKPRYGKTTLAKRLMNPANTVLIEAFKLDRAIKNVETLIFDDINSEHVEKWQTELIFEYLTNHGHYHINNIVLIAQHLKRVPQHLLDMVDFIVFFKSPKMTMKLLPHFSSLKHANELLTIVTKLQKYECVVFDFRNNSISPIMTNKELPIKELMEKPLEGNSFHPF